jgi:hypothetical protein
MALIDFKGAMQAPIRLVNDTPGGMIEPADDKSKHRWNSDGMPS